MRISMSLTVAAFVLTIGAAAQAQAPINPYQSGEAVEVQAPIEQAPVQQPIDPYSAYPAPPAYGYQAPSAGPPVAPPAPPSYQQGYYLYPSDRGQAPVYYAPPPGAYRGCCCCCQQAGACSYAMVPRLVRPKKVWDGARRFSLGAHVGFLTLNQQVGSNQVSLGGAGFQLRLRSAGHWGFEASQSFLHGSYWSGAFQRDSFPFQLSLMFYLFPNKDAHHFNIYALAGVGLVADSVTLNDENRQQVTQDFTEVELHAGLGAELRFKWFAIEADARYLGLWRDNSDQPASYYGNLKGGPVQASSEAVQGNLYLSLWF